ncbi:MAG: hypothetical protein JJE15_13110, partial [Desulfobacteraceae bacterium]|nr:hypothetical protein [Desulfobacteraceae bacterium]
DEFAYGTVTPQAIKDFLSYAYANWTPPAPQYVLFLGTGNMDYKDRYGDLFGPAWSSINYVPTYLTYTQHMGETLTDEWFVRVSGDDAVPDLYIGRLPATSATQAAVMVRKIIAYESAANTKTWEKNTLFIADNQTEDYETVFETMNDDAAAFMPTAMNTPFKGYLGDYLVSSDLTNDIKAKVNEGALVVNYSGHGSIQIWAHEGIFRGNDVPDLTNSAMLPLVVSMSCLNGYFAYPAAWNFPSLADVLLRTEGKGAVAAFMPTGMTEPSGQHILDSALFDAFFTKDIRTLGPAVSQAKQTLLANGSNYEEVSATFLLFADPAMVLKVPVPRRPTGLEAEVQAENISLSWQGATDCNGAQVAGYNLYRSLTSGGTYSKLNASLIAQTSYDDTLCDTGTTYYYVAKAVDADGDESVETQEVSATLPTPASSGGGGGGGCFIGTAGGKVSWDRAKPRSENDGKS